MLKYIRHPRLGFIIFESPIGHNDIARYLGIREEIISAGFISPGHTEDETLQCYGESMTLEKKAHPDDTGRLNLFLKI